MATAVALAPLPFGSTDHSTIAFWCIFLGLGLIAASPRNLRTEQYYLLVLAGLVILAYSFVLHEQLASTPWLAKPHPLWRETSDLLGIELEPSVSIARHQPFFSLGASLAAMLATICSFVVCTDPVRARQLLKIVAWSGVVYAIYGFASYLADPTSLLWREKQAYLNVITATFINRNTAAVYFGSCTIVWLLFLCDRIRDQLPTGPIYWRSVASHLLRRMSRDILVASSMLFICLAAMFMTGSRAGAILSLVAMMIAFVAFFYGDLPRRRSLIGVLAIGGLLSIFLLQVLGAGISSRFAAQGLEDEGRFETYRSTLRMIADHPWFGTGLGTFVWSYPAYRSSQISLWGVWDRAHSTPLELAADLGLPLAGLIVVSWFVVFAVLIQGVQTRRRNQIIPIAAFSIAFLALSHSSIDFSLQIPGYAIVVFSLLGAGLAQSFSRKKNISKSPENRPSGT